MAIQSEEMSDSTSPPLINLKFGLNDWLFEKYNKVGKQIAINPRTVLIVCIAFTLVTGLGWIKLVQDGPEERPEKLYTPQDSKAYSDYYYVKKHYDLGLRMAKVMFTDSDWRKDTGDVNLIENESKGKAIIEDMFDLYEDIENDESLEVGLTTEVHGQTDVNPRKALRKVCYRNQNNDCRKASVLGFWNYTRSIFIDDDDWIETMSSTATLDYDGYGFSTYLDPDSIFGKTERDSNGILTRVGAFQYVFYNENDEKTVGRKTFDVDADLFEAALMTYVDDFKIDSKNEKTLLITTYTDYERGEAVSNSFAQDGSVLTMLSYVIITGYAMFVLSDANDPVKSQSTLGLMTVFVVGCSVLSSFGILMGLGVPFSLVVNSVIFVMLGLGVDDAFIVLEALDRYRRECDGLKTPQERSVEIGRALADAGTSITLTSVTDFAAFLVGTTTSIPAIQAFCTFAAVTIFIDFILQVTLFIVYVLYDEVRREEKRPDRFAFCCACYRAYQKQKRERQRQKQMELLELENTVENVEGGGGHSPPKAEQAIEKPSKAEQVRDDQSTEVDQPMEEASQESFVKTLIRKKLPKVLTSHYGKVSVLALSCVFVIMGAIGITQLKLDFQFKWFTPHYDLWGNPVPVKEAMELSEVFFEGENLPFGVFTKNVDYFSHRDDLETLVSRVKKNEWVEGSMVNSWYAAWNSQTGNAGKNAASSDDFYTELSDWLETEAGSVYASEIKFNDARTSIVSSRILAAFKDMDSGQENIDAMTSLRESVDFGENNLKVIVYAPPMLFWEGLAVVYGETLRNIGIGLAAVFVVCCVFLENLYAGVLCTVNIILIDVCLLGFIHWCGEYMNTVTGINLLLALGLTVDYSAHILHAFIHSPPGLTRDERVHYAFNHIGVSVFNGGMTTFVAIFSLVGATSYVFQNFFVCFLLIIAFGLYFGMVFLPVVLSLIGPDAQPIKMDADTSLDDEHTTPKDGEESQQRKEIELA